jgi:hypothetical protein
MLCGKNLMSENMLNKIEIGGIRQMYKPTQAD